MERYQRGHQQPVEGERPIGVLLVFACLTVAIAAVLWGLNAARQQRPGTASDLGSDSAVASQKDEMRRFGCRCHGANLSADARQAVWHCDGFA